MTSHQKRISDIKLFEKIEKRLSELPIFCRVCGERLTVQSTYPNSETLGCSGTGSAGRKIADQHYSDSRTEMSTDTIKAYEMLERELRALLELE